MAQGALEPSELIDRLEEVLALEDEAERAAALASLLESVRAEDVAEVLAHFPAERKIEIFRALPPEAHPEVIDETDWDTTRELVSELSPPDLGRIVEQMPPDEAADLIGDLSDEDRRELFAELEPETIGEVQRLLEHHPESAGGIMTSETITVTADRTAGEVLEILQKEVDSEVVDYVYVTDVAGRLIGVFTIRDLLRASPETPVSEFMEIELITARTDDDQEHVATLARKYNLKSIPIVDEAGRLVGLATIDDIIDILAEEADEDIYRMAGTPDSHPAQLKTVRRALLRLPWLLLPVVSGFVIAGLHEEDGSGPSLGETITLVAFIPLVMGIAGAVGTQTATMMVRGIATGDIEIERSRKIFLQELGVGTIIALAIGGLVATTVTALTALGLLSGSTTLAAAVGLGLSVGILIASLCGALFPIGCEKIGLDPALVAGPFITSFNDVVAAATYLAVAQLVLAWGG